MIENRDREGLDGRIWGALKCASAFVAASVHGPPHVLFRQNGQFKIIQSPSQRLSFDTQDTGPVYIRMLSTFKTAHNQDEVRLAEMAIEREREPPKTKCEFGDAELWKQARRACLCCLLAELESLLCCL